MAHTTAEDVMESLRQIAQLVEKREAAEGPYSHIIPGGEQCRWLPDRWRLSQSQGMWPGCGNSAAYPLGDGAAVCSYHYEKLTKHFEKMLEMDPHLFRAARAVVEARQETERAKSEALRWEQADKDVERRRTGGLVYYVERDGWVKIGTTTNLTERLRALGRGGCVMPEGMTLGPVALLATHRGGQRAEAIIHRRFHPDRVAGEWFVKSETLSAHIERIASRRRATESA